MRPGACLRQIVAFFPVAAEAPVIAAPLTAGSATDRRDDGPSLPAEKTWTSTAASKAVSGASGFAAKAGTKSPTCGKARASRHLISARAAVAL